MYGVWTITHVDRLTAKRVKTFSYPPSVWPTAESAQKYLDAMLRVGDLKAKVLGDQADTLRVEEIW